MRAPLLLLTLLFASCLRLFAVELTEGITRAELESLVGKPISVMQRGDKLVLAYPKKGRAEFVGGKLVYFERIEVLDTPAPAKPQTTPAAAPAGSLATPRAQAAQAAGAAPGATASAPTASASTGVASTAAATKAPVKKPASAPASTGPAASAVKAPPSTPSATAPSSAKPSSATGPDSETEEAGDEPESQLTPEQRAHIAKQEAEMAKLQERLLNGESLAPQGSSMPEPTNPWLLMLLQSLFKIPITVVVLKLAFKWSDVDADWSQMWLPAAVDTLVRFGVQAIAQAAWGLDTLFYIDETLAFFALLATLIKTTHACTLIRAVGVAFAAKLASVVVWAILSVFILGLLFHQAHS